MPLASPASRITADVSSCSWPKASWASLHLGQPLVQAPGPGPGRVAGGTDLLLGFLGAGQGGRRRLRRPRAPRPPGRVQAGQVAVRHRGLERRERSGPPGDLLVEGRLFRGAEQRRTGQVGAAARG